MQIQSIQEIRFCDVFGRCYLVTGQIRWLCEQHQKEQRVTVISDAALGPASFDTASDFDRELKRLVSDMGHLTKPFLKERADKKPRLLPPWQMVVDIPGDAVASLVVTHDASSHYLTLQYIIAFSSGLSYLSKNEQLGHVHLLMKPVSTFDH